MRKSVKQALALAAMGLTQDVFAAEVCPWQPVAKPGPAITLDIDKVWSGVRVNFSGARRENKFVVGYYDQDRWLTIADVDATTRTIARQRLATQFGGWDSHNGVALEVDNGGLVHVAANMHANELKYFRSAGPGMPLAVAPMTGLDESHVTYPAFLRDENGNLLFIYRSGTSGNGTWLVNRWDGTNWSRVGRQSFLGDRGFGTHVSGYPSRFVLSRDGYFHLAIVWRLNPDAATNVRLSYAKTKDFLSWFDSDNRPLHTPLTPETAETVLNTGPNAGLLNNAKVSIDGRGRPVIVFTRQNSQGFNTVELAVHEKSEWSFSTVATAVHITPVKGTGSLAETVAFTEVDFAAPDRPMLYYRFPHEAGVREALDPSTLAVACAVRPAPDGKPKVAPRPMVKPIPQVQPIDEQSALMWLAQPAHNDRPYECTEEAPSACNPPPSTLKLVVY
jgi:hypothetical protein